MTYGTTKVVPFPKPARIRVFEQTVKPYPFNPFSTESGQLDQVIEGDSLQGVAGFAPGGQAAGDYEDFES